MKLLVLALTVALLFTAGESVTDSPLNKHYHCCCATGRSAFTFISLHYTGVQSQQTSKLKGTFFHFATVVAVIKMKGIMQKTNDLLVKEEHPMWLDAHL